ncbi:methyltransferase type 11 [Acrocarpospora phusangensis]|uniref:Methyltransferase type 11 n=1 Tax=Acrocarpospora phusangensis TaxID=1070424 RepID=A0A919QBK2_9ACTN|nr:class I SAM-dependent methyltransferase [Acrocarpospora phusangensis]GIH25897.1 methyltransferase type 11 [Acrocarpospora phusangensis]
MAADRTTLRQTFDTDPGRYDRARPGYPPELFDRLPDGRVLEIGCGTGQATEPLAARGHPVVAVELGAGLAAFTRRKLARFPAVEVVTADFETWPLPEEPFDLVLAATSFHWLDPATRVARAARALRPGGVLATVSTHHIAGGTRRFFADAQTCYLRFDPDTPPDLRLQSPDEIPVDSAEIDASPDFGPAVFHRYEWDKPYSTQEYLDVLSTYSNHIALPDDARTGLLNCLATLIDRDHGGRIVKRYMTELRLAERL